MSHNSLSIEAVYVSDSGLWKLGSFESARQFDQLSAEFLRTCQPCLPVDKQVCFCLTGE